MRVLLAVVAAALALVPSSLSSPAATKVAFIGCSNTRMAVMGYGAVGGTKFWTPVGAMYNGGTISRWAFDGRYWSQFRYVDSAQPGADAVWMQFCTFPQEGLNQSIAAAVKVILDLRDMKPGIPVYVSTLNGYADGVCRLTGPGGVDKGAAIRDWLVAHGVANRGPDMPALTTAQLMSDGCHPNPDGMAALGAALRGFFG